MLSVLVFFFCFFLFCPSHHISVFFPFSFCFKMWLPRFSGSEVTSTHATTSNVDTGCRAAGRSDLSCVPCCLRLLLARKRGNPRNGRDTPDAIEQTNKQTTKNFPHLYRHLYSFPRSRADQMAVNVSTESEEGSSS